MEGGASLRLAVLTAMLATSAAAQAPTHSSTIVLSNDEATVYVVNPDADTVSAIDVATLQELGSEPVDASPRTVAVAPDGTLWVVCQDDATVRVLDGVPGSTLATIALPHASAPYGIAMRPDGGAAYVSLSATGEVAELDPATRSLERTVAVGPTPRGIAVTADSERVFVTRFLSEVRPTTVRTGQPASGAVSGLPRRIGGNVHARGVLDARAQVYELSAASFSPVRTHALALDDGPDNGHAGRGIPNYLVSATISPDGARLWLPSKKDNVLRGTYHNGRPLTFETSVRTIVSQIDLGTNREDRAARIDFNDSSMAYAVVFDASGTLAFHALMASNKVEVRDASTGALVAEARTARSPQGLVLTSDGSRLFVQNFLSRSVGVYDASGVVAGTSTLLPRIAEIGTVDVEPLAPDVLRGKQLFHDATDRRMNLSGYITCSSCHLEGGHDGMVWDFTDRGEGLRNTTSLVGKRGTGHGNVHWTANFDEIQDFENDMRSHFAGRGFLSDEVFHSGTVAVPLGQPKAGLDPDLDAIAAYVTSLAAFGLSPHRDPSGALTPAGARGRTLFGQLGCATCHMGADFTDSATGAKHDVGTIRASSGQASGGPLTGLDTPTLRGLWATAPYLHDGSATTLRDVLTTRNPSGRHGATNTLRASDLADLVAYLLQIDDLEPAAP